MNNGKMLMFTPTLSNLLMDMLGNSAESLDVKTVLY
jgi:hypothetical protein